MPHPAPTDASPTGAPRSLRCRRPAAERGHRAAAGELAELAFLMPAGAAQPAPALPRPRPAAE
ncbi:hypothetical protein [Pseudonocardia sp. NPDC046786]|uniref:hypothetical protein n=1 Tax=Pseudonocardia sp. NPDC046786 TaxID=3155471 RepID=UPI0033D1EB8D